MLLSGIETRVPFGTTRPISGLLYSLTQTLSSLNVAGNFLKTSATQKQKKFIHDVIQLEGSLFYT